MPLSTSYFFHQLSPEELAFLQSITKTKRYPEGEILFYAGESPRVLHILEEGIVKIYKHDSAANEVHLAYFHPSEMIAEMAHFEAIPYPATARCETDVQVHEIHFETFKGYLSENPKLAFHIIRSLTQKIKQLESIVQRSLIDDAPTRLARFLLEHDQSLSTITQRKIANYLVLTPETVSRIIRRFKAEGWVEVVDKKLTLLDPESVRNFLEQRS